MLWDIYLVDIAKFYNSERSRGRPGLPLRRCLPVGFSTVVMNAASPAGRPVRFFSIFRMRWGFVERIAGPVVRTQAVYGKESRGLFLKEPPPDPRKNF